MIIAHAFRPALVLGLIGGFLLANRASAQLPSGFYAWWSSPVVEDLNLTRPQRQQIRETVRGYRPQLLQLRAEIDQAELDLEAEFNHDPVDQQKANETIERLAKARSELTRMLSRMSLQLRVMLTETQWQELQRRRPERPRRPATETK